MNYTYSNGSGMQRNRSRARAFGSAYAVAQMKPYEEPKPEPSKPAEETASSPVVAEAQTVTEAAQTQEGAAVAETGAVTDVETAQTISIASEARTVTISLPGSAARVPLALGTLQSGVTYDPDTAKAVIAEAGRYNLKFSLVVDSPINTKCAFTVMVNGRMIRGGAFCISLKKGRQSWSESLEAALDAGDAIGLAFNSASPLVVSISGDGPLPELAIDKITG